MDPYREDLERLIEVARRLRYSGLEKAYFVDCEKVVAFQYNITNEDIKRLEKIEGVRLISVVNADQIVCPKAHAIAVILHLDKPKPKKTED